MVLGSIHTAACGCKQFRLKNARQLAAISHGSGVVGHAAGCPAPHPGAVCPDCLTLSNRRAAADLLRELIGTRLDLKLVTWGQDFIP